MEMIWGIVEAGVVVTFANRMLKVGHALRERVLTVSDVLLSDDGFPGALKAEIMSIEPHLAEPKLAWLFAVGVGPSLIRARFPGAQADLPSDLSVKWREPQRLTIGAALMNSPAAFLLFVLQVMIITFFMSFNSVADTLLVKVGGRLVYRPGPWRPGSVHR